MTKAMMNDHLKTYFYQQLNEDAEFRAEIGEYFNVKNQCNLRIQEKACITRALELTHGCVSEAMVLCGIAHHRTFYDRCVKHNIHIRDYQR